MKKIIILCSGLLILWGCSKKNSTDIDWTSVTTQLKARELKTDSSLFIGLDNPIMYKNKVVGEQRNSKLLRFCQITDDSIRCFEEFLNIGNGPYEVKMPRFYWNFKEQLLIICDYANRENKIIYIPTGNFSNISDVNTWEVSKFTPFKINNNVIAPHSLACLEKGKFIAIPVFYADRMFAYIDNVNDTIKLLNFDYPDDKCGITSSKIRPFAYTGWFKKHPYENKFVHFTSLNRYMLIAEYKNGEIKEIASPYKMYPQYTLEEDGRNIRRNKECYLGARKVYPTANHIYILMNDMTVDDSRNGKLTDGYSTSYCNEIYVFDWEGKPVRKYLLDHRVQNIWVDENDEAIYATTEDMENLDRGTVFLRYSL